MRDCAGSKAERRRSQVVRPRRVIHTRLPASVRYDFAYGNARDRPSEARRPLSRGASPGLPAHQSRRGGSLDSCRSPAPGRGPCASRGARRRGRSDRGCDGRGMVDGDRTVRMVYRSGVSSSPRCVSWPAGLIPRRPTQGTSTRWRTRRVSTPARASRASTCSLVALTKGPVPVLVVAPFGAPSAHPVLHRVDEEALALLAALEAICLAKEKDVVPDQPQRVIYGALPPSSRTTSRVEYESPRPRRCLSGALSGLCALAGQTGGCASPRPRPGGLLR